MVWKSWRWERAVGGGWMRSHREYAACVILQTRMRGEVWECERRWRGWRVERVRGWRRTVEWKTGQQLSPPLLLCSHSTFRPPPAVDLCSAHLLAPTFHLTSSINQPISHHIPRASFLPIFTLSCLHPSHSRLLHHGVSSLQAPVSAAQLPPAGQEQHLPLAARRAGGKRHRCRYLRLHSPCPFLRRPRSRPVPPAAGAEPRLPLRCGDAGQAQPLRDAAGAGLRGSGQEGEGHHRQRRPRRPVEHGPGAGDPTSQSAAGAALTSYGSRHISRLSPPPLPSSRVPVERFTASGKFAHAWADSFGQPRTAPPLCSLEC